MTLRVCERFSKLPSELNAENEAFLAMLAIERLWLGGTDPLSDEPGEDTGGG